MNTDNNGRDIDAEIEARQVEGTPMSPADADDGLQPTIHSRSLGQPGALCQNPWESTGSMVSKTKVLDKADEQAAQLGARVKHGIKISAVVLMLTGGFVALYAFWYQNPEKVIMDGLSNALRDTSLSYSGNASSTERGSLRLEFDGVLGAAASSTDVRMSFATDEKQHALRLRTVSNTGKQLYFRVDNAREIPAVLSGVGMVDASVGAINSFIETMDGQWVRADTGMLAENDLGVVTTQGCIGELVRRMHADEKMLSDFFALYSKHRFIVVDKRLDSIGGDMGYIVSIDAEKEREFAKAFRLSSLFKTLGECDASYDIHDEQLAGLTNGSNDAQLEIWVSRWTHKLRKIRYSATSTAGVLSVFSIDTDDNALQPDTPTQALEPGTDTMADLQEILWLAFGGDIMPVSVRQRLE